jgi:hypothetical protein
VQLPLKVFKLYFLEVFMHNSYKLEVEEKLGYLHFRVTGENSFETVRQYLNHIRVESIRRGYSAVLIEEDLEGPGLSVSDIFRIASENSTQTNRYMGRIAYVDINKKHSSSNMQFAETVAVNRGINVRVFSSVRQAEEWIKNPEINPASEFSPVH